MLTDGKTYACACATHKEVHEGVLQGRKSCECVTSTQRHYEQVRKKKKKHNLKCARCEIAHEFPTKGGEYLETAVFVCLFVC